MKYKTILADPPWYEHGAGAKCVRGAQRHYPLMQTAEIIEYMSAIPIDDNAHLYLWVTNRFLPDGLQVMRALGFEYLTNLVWVKDTIGLGQYFRGQHELLLFGKRGQPPYKKAVNAGRSRATISTVINARKRGHSIKPDKQYRIIEATSYPPYLEVFARRRKHGWDSWGNETDPTDPLESFAP